MPGPVKLDTTPAGVIRPIELLTRFVNHRFPSGPAVIAPTSSIFGSVKLVNPPAVVIRPIA